MSGRREWSRRGAREARTAPPPGPASCREDHQTADVLRPPGAGPGPAVLRQPASAGALRGGGRTHGARPGAAAGAAPPGAVRPGGEFRQQPPGVRLAQLCTRRALPPAVGRGKLIRQIVKYSLFRLTRPLFCFPSLVLLTRPLFCFPSPFLFQSPSLLFPVDKSASV